MMEVFKFLLFSVIQGLALLTFMLTLFRFNPRYYLIPILVVSVVISISSYFFREQWDMAYLDPFIYLAILIIGTIWMLEVNLLLAVLISFSGYMGFVFIQTLIMLLLKVIGVLTFENLNDSYHFQTALLSVSTSFIVILLSWFLFRKGWGFTFSFKKKKNIREITLFVSIILLVITVIATILLCLYNNKFDNLYAFLVLFLSALVILLYFALIKEKRND